MENPRIVMANTGIRSLPLRPDLANILTWAAQQAGVDTVRVFSGGQPSSGPRRTGSHRHDGGGAGDIQLFVKGRPVSYLDPAGRAIFSRFVTAASAAGATGIGAGPGYMGGKNSIHVGFGPPAVWGAGGRSANAPDWLRVAFDAGRANPMKPGPVSMAASAPEIAGGGRGGAAEAPVPLPRLAGGGRGGSADAPIAPIPGPAMPPPAETDVGNAFAGLGSGLSLPAGGAAELDAPTGPLQAGLAADQSAMEMRKMHDFLLPAAENTSTSGRPVPKLFGDAAANPKMAEGLFQKLFARPGLADIGGGIRIRA